MPIRDKFGHDWYTLDERKPADNAFYKVKTKDGHFHMVEFEKGTCFILSDNYDFNRTIDLPLDQIESYRGICGFDF